MTRSYLPRRARTWVRRLRSLRGGPTRRVAAWPNLRIPSSETVDPLRGARETLDWIFRSQDASDDGGSSAYFDVCTNRWSGSYPETTGYTIVSLFEALDTLSLETGLQDEIEGRIRRMTEWLLRVQRDDGSFPGGHERLESSPPQLFNTAQVLSGLLRVAQRWNDSDARAAAQRAADWMCDIQEADGRWERHIYDRDCRAYLVRAAWPLAQAALFDEMPAAPRRRRAVLNFLQWALPLQKPNDWFDRASFFLDDDTGEYRVLHTIAYTIEGFLETGALLGHEKSLAAALAAAERLLRRFEIDGILWAEYDERWRPLARYVCVTGCAQMGRIWGRGYELTRDVRYLNALLKMNDGLRHVQPGPGAPEATRGGFPGSIPIYERYQPNAWPNWAAKFALDSFLIEIRLQGAVGSSQVLPAPLAPMAMAIPHRGAP